MVFSNLLYSFWNKLLSLKFTSFAFNSLIKFSEICMIYSTNGAVITNFFFVFDNNPLTVLNAQFPYLFKVVLFGLNLYYSLCFFCYYDCYLHFFCYFPPCFFYYYSLCFFFIKVQDLGVMFYVQCNSLSFYYLLSFSRFYLISFI